MAVHSRSIRSKLTSKLLGYGHFLSFRKAGSGSEAIRPRSFWWVFAVALWLPAENLVCVASCYASQTITGSQPAAIKGSFTERAAILQKWQ